MDTMTGVRSVWLGYRVLGPVQLLADGEAVPLPGSKSRAILAALLITRNSVVSMDALINALWDDDPPTAARSGLQVAMSGLRRAIRATGAADPIHTEPPGYRIVVDPSALDLDQFLQARRSARAYLAAGDAPRASAQFQDALRQFTGEPLDDLQDLRFATEFATAWREERAATVAERIDADLACGRHQEVVGELVALTQANPLRERLWAQLIVALQRSGRQADALDAARRLRTVLADELGIDPSPELRALEQRILRQEPEPPLAQNAPPRMSVTITEESGPPGGALVDDLGRYHPISSRGLRIGREPTCDIVLTSGKVSRQHAVVQDTGSGFVLTDLNSTNGTTLNARRVVGLRDLADGDVIGVADARFVFRAGLG